MAKAERSGGETACLQAAPLFIPDSQGSAEPAADAWCFVVRGGQVLLLDESTPAVPRRGLLGGLDIPWHHLGRLDGADCIVAVLDESHEPPGLVPHSLRPLHALVPDVIFQIAGRAVQIAEWHLTHRFCGRCGTRTDDSPGERAKRCPACGLLAFPRVAPAVIMRVTRGSEVLLAHGRRFPEPIYSVLAGFVDPGESLEECVAREIFEEVGIRVSDIRYFSSQPWPFPHSLMVGFTAEYESGEIVIDEAEIVDACWFDRDNLPPLLPGRISIARRLLDDWSSLPPE
jgi:NAD+ diphosphatase